MAIQFEPPANDERAEILEEGAEAVERASLFPWDERDGCSRFKHASEFDELPQWARSLIWARKKDKETGAEVLILTPCVTNVIGLLRHDRRWAGVLSVDDMAKRMTTTALPPWHSYEPSTRTGGWDADTDPVRLVDWLARAYGFQLSAERCGQAALVVAQDRRFHPVQVWLEGLEPHDGTNRVESFFVRYFGAPDTPYVRAVGVVLLVSLVARAMHPGCKVDTVVVLEGAQGKKKSTACKVLVGERWFAENTCDVGTKDAQLALHGKWLIEMPELAGMARSQVEAIKAFFSKATDWLRPPYGKNFQDMPRSSCCVATTNDDQYLKDRTGNRRYLPIACTGAAIDVKGIERDREQVFAEALELYRSGTPWWIEDQSLLPTVEAQTERRETVDPWEPRLAAWIHARGSDGRVRGEAGIQVSDALAHVEVPIDRQTANDAARVGAILRRLKLEVYRPLDRAAAREAATRGQTYQRPRFYRWPNPDADAPTDEADQ